MFKRLLMIWLMLCTLGYGSVWAWDGHVNEAAEHHMVVSDADHASDADKEHPTCDHCCHASAHIMALCTETFGLIQGHIATGYTPYQQSIFFHSTAPPDQPPRS
jgi:hypothetical protein